MDIASFAGAAAVTCTTIHVCLGLPAQLRKNYLRKSCEGLSLSMVIMWLSNYASWTCYGFFAGDTFVLYAHIPGTILISVLIYQFFVYQSTNLRLPSASTEIGGASSVAA